MSVTEISRFKSTVGRRQIWAYLDAHPDTVNLTIKQIADKLKTATGHSFGVAAVALAVKIWEARRNGESRPVPQMKPFEGFNDDAEIDIDDLVAAKEFVMTVSNGDHAYAIRLVGALERLQM